MDVAGWALGVSIAGFVVAATSATFTGLTYWRNRTPRPKWLIEWDDGGGDLITDAVRCVVSNRGRGDALDVTLRAVDTAGKQLGYRSAHAEVVPFGQHLELWFTFRDAEMGLALGEVLILDESGGHQHIPGIDSRSSRTVQVELSYHRAPNVSKTRCIRRSHTDPR